MLRKSRFFQNFEKVPEKNRVPGGCVNQKWKKGFSQSPRVEKVENGKKTGVEEVTGPVFDRV